MGLFDFLKEKSKITFNESAKNSTHVSGENSKSMHQPECSDDAGYFVRGYISENRIHLGSYYKNPGDREEIYLIFEENEYFLESEAWWPVHRGASNGGHTKNKFDTEYLILSNIYNLEDFFNSIYRGNLEPCCEKIKIHENILSFLNELIQTKTAPNYCTEGISLLWTLNEQSDGVIIHKCFSKEREILDIPTYINSIPVVEFGSRAFVGMECKKIIIPDTLKRLNGISGCKNIREINIPATVEECCPFSDCETLENIFVENGNETYVSVDGVLYNADKTKLLRCPQNKTGVLVIDDSALRVENWACCNCRALTQIVFPNNIKSIGMYAFKNCISVHSFCLPDGIENLSWGAFANIQRERIICTESSYSYKELEKNYSNENWHK